MARLIINETPISIKTEAELCLLLCGMFPKDYIIPIEDLVIYGMGLKLFADVPDIIGARHRVPYLVDVINDLTGITHDLRYHSLSLKLRRRQDGCDNQYVKRQAGAYDSLLSISSVHKLVVGRDIVIRKWPEKNKYESFYGLSLVLRNIRKHPLNLECPSLAILQIQYGEDSQSLPIIFFEGMKQLQVLSLDVPLLSQSLGMLENLQTLRLKVQKLEDMSTIRGLMNLEFLSISTVSLTDIPMEIGQLNNLRLLDLSKMNIRYFPPGVLSRMMKLEELYMPLSFIRWGCRAKAEDDDYYEEKSEKDDNYDGEERVNASLSEIVSLLLNALHISIPKGSIFPKNSTIFENLQRFKILVPNNFNCQSFGKGPMNKLQLTGDAIDIKESGICDLLCRTVDLSLIRVRNMKNVNYVVGRPGDYYFPQLKKLIITECDELEHLVDVTDKDIAVRRPFFGLKCLHLSMLCNMKEIWHGTSTTTQFWFVKLRQINIRFCHKLKYAFPLSIAKEFRQLQRIEILDCNELEGIFCINKPDDNFTGAFSCIEELHLHSLPKLIGFLVQADNAIDEVCNETTHSSGTNEVFLSKNEDISCDMDMEMYCAFSSKLLMEERLGSLKKLTLAFCGAIKVIFSFKENHGTTHVLDSLKELELFSLPNLVHIWFQIPPNTTAFRNLQLLALSECHNLYVLLPRVVKLLVQLQKMQISRCTKMKEIIMEEDENPVMDKIVFPRLKALELQHMPNLRIFYGGITAIELPLLESLKLNQCNKMECFSYGPITTPLLERIQMNGSSYSFMADLNATMKRTV